MSKSKPQLEKITLQTFSVGRKDSGYCITRHTIEDGVLTESKQITEPDVLRITIAHLETITRKSMGL